MKFLFVIFFSFYTLFMSGCWWQEEDVRESITLGLSPKGMYDLAQKSIDEGAIDEAIKIFERIQAAYPSSRYSMQSEIDTIYNLYKRERYDEGISKINEFVTKYPNHFVTPYAYYLRGVIAENKSRSLLDEFLTDNAQRDISSARDAFNYYLDLTKKFPNNKYSEEAKTRLIPIRNLLSRHELFVAIFYTERKAHIAAINRCKFIIEKFPNTPSVPAALNLLAYNYDKINAPKLAEDSRRVLNASYPKYTPHYSLED